MRGIMCCIIIGVVVVGTCFAMALAQQKGDAGPQGSQATGAAGQDGTKIDPAFEKDIRALLTLLKLKEITRQKFTEMLPGLHQTLPDVPLENLEKAVDALDWDGLVSAVIPAYAKHLTHEDVKASNAFFASPAGRHYVEAQPSIAAESAAASRAWGTKAGAQLVVEALKLTNEPAKE